MKKFVCQVCGYIYEAKIRRQHVQYVKLRQASL